MVILQVHNEYRQPGGEDRVVEAEAALLRRLGHQVLQYRVSNRSIGDHTSGYLVGTAVWNHARYLELRDLIRRGQPQVVHVHNTLPLVSPAVYYAAKAEGVAVVQTLHNYRPACGSGVLFRQGQYCGRCLGRRIPWPLVVHRCYRGSRAASTAVGVIHGVHNVVGTWKKKVDLYIALAESSRRAFTEAGLPSERIRVKPNFVHPDPGVSEGRSDLGLFVGRLSPEKGLRTLLAAHRQMKEKTLTVIVGDGPMSNTVTAAAREIPGLQSVGFQQPEVAMGLMGRALFVVVPSVWHETFGLVVVESFAKGTPVIASNIGSLADLVEHGRTGLHFRAGDAGDLARWMEWARAHPDELVRMGRGARAEFEAKYTAERNYQILIDIYREGIRINSRAPR